RSGDAAICRPRPRPCAGDRHRRRPVQRRSGKRRRHDLVPAGGGRQPGLFRGVKTMADSTSPAPASGSRPNRWLKIALIVSLALNVAFIAWGATRFVKFRHIGERPGSMIEERIAHHLPDDAADAFRRAMAETRRGQAVSFSALRDDIAEALAAEPVDRARLEALDRKSTRVNSSHVHISYAVLCLINII